MATKIWVKFGSGNRLVINSTKLLADPVYIIAVVLWHVFGNNFKRSADEFYT